MCIARCVLAVVALHVGVVHSWDIAVSVKDQLIFYTNGTKTNIVNLISQNPTSLVYDEIHNMMLYVDKQSNNDTICGYDLSSKDNKCFIKRNGRNIHGLAFDPVTEKIFFTDTNERSINFISLKRGSNNSIYGNLLVKMDDHDQTPAAIAIDSCNRYIYWTYTITNGKIGTAQINGSERNVISLTRSYYKPFSLAIDPQTQKMFYLDVCEQCAAEYLYKADLNGANKQMLSSSSSSKESLSKVVTISKDYIYWKSSSKNYDYIWQLPKSTESIWNSEPKEIIKLFKGITLGITAKYKIHDQANGIQDCSTLSSVIATTTVSPGYTGERRDVCENNCLHGNCSLNDEGHPKCSCNAGYTGERCEVFACHGYCLNDGSCSLNENSEPVCFCKGDHTGNRCEVSECWNYCMHGNCSFSGEGHPTCSCNAGYSGERCEVSACHSFCLNGGDCSLNEEDEPVCQCVVNYEGPRCETNINNTTPTFDLAKKNLTLADFLSTWRKPSSKMFLVVEV